VNDPVIIRFDPNDRPIMSISIQSTDRSIRDLTDLADQVIANRLESIPGVGGVNVNGGTPREIRVQLSPEAMQAYQVSPQQVSQALARENLEIPAGRVYLPDKEQLVRVTGRIRDPRMFGDVVVTTRQGTPVRVRDLATVVDGSSEERSAAFLGDREQGEVRAVSVEVLKISGSNTVEVADAVRATLNDLSGSLPEDIVMQVIRDDSEKIHHALSDVQITIMLGAVLTILIIYLFLNSWRSTVITGLTLPISVISAFFAMYMFGFTINTMTLLALSLAIGLLIDDAIVVRENIVRHIEMGKDHYRAS
jgi:HAE1 family hydrophobic/amphiphilic exporter-1